MEMFVMGDKYFTFVARQQEKKRKRNTGRKKTRKRREKKSLTRERRTDISPADIFTSSTACSASAR